MSNDPLDNKPQISDNLFAGILFLLVSHIIAFAICSGIGLLLMELGWLPMIFLFPFTLLPFWLFIQIIYVIPLYLLFQRNRQPSTAKGIVIGAVITALINGGCSIILLST